MKGISIGLLAQWGKDLTYYLTPFFCLVNWDMYYPGSACRGTDLPPDRILHIQCQNVHHCGAGGSMRACHIAGPSSIPGFDKFPEWVFFWDFSWPVIQMSGMFRPHGFPNITRSITVILIIPALSEWMCERMVRTVFNFRVVSKVPSTLSYSLIRGGPPCPCTVKIECMWCKVNSLSRQVVAL